MGNFLSYVSKASSARVYYISPDYIYTHEECQVYIVSLDTRDYCSISFNSAVTGHSPQELTELSQKSQQKSGPAEIFLL